MAFTTEQKLQIVQLLGWPANSINPTSIYYNNILNNRLMVVMPEAQTMVIEMLGWIEEMDDKIESSVDSAGIKRFDDIEFFGADESGTKLNELRKERQTLIKELSQLLDIPMKKSGGMGDVCL